MRVLIVEDEPLVAEGIAACIELIGYETAGIAYTGEDAIGLARELLPDVMIMDIRLPDISGIDAVTEIGKHWRIPCVFLTAYTDIKLVEEVGKMEGVYGYLVKPATDSEIKAALDIAMIRHGERQKAEMELKRAQTMLEDRKLIERAKGVLMDNFNLKESAAMEMLQKKSKDKNKKLVEIAKEIIHLFGK